MPIDFAFVFFHSKQKFGPHYLFICSVRVLPEKGFWFVYFKLIRCYFLVLKRKIDSFQQQQLYKRWKTEERKKKSIRDAQRSLCGLMCYSTWMRIYIHMKRLRFFSLFFSIAMLINKNYPKRFISREKTIRKVIFIISRCARKIICIANVIASVKRNSFISLERSMEKYRLYYGVRYITL